MQRPGVYSIPWKILEAGAFLLIQNTATEKEVL